MPLCTLGSTCDRKTSGVASYHRPLKAHMIGRRLAWHARMALGQHTRSTDVARGNPSSQLCSTRFWTTSRVACPHRPWPAHPVEQRLAWHAIVALGKHTRLEDVFQCYHCPWVVYTLGRRRASNVIIALWTTQTVGRRRRGNPSSPFDYTHG